MVNAFSREALPMLRARLERGSWRFEDDALARLRDKIVVGRKTLGEVYGAPLYGIKTGLNDAFVIDRATRDRLDCAEIQNRRTCSNPSFAARTSSAGVWRARTFGLSTRPKGKVDIERYPSIRNWLLPFKPDLEKRADEARMVGVQQAQLAYQPRFESIKIVYPDIADHSRFAIDDASYSRLHHIHGKFHRDRV